jgi:hypothetical protein
MPRKNVNFCIVDFEESTSILSLRALIPLQGTVLNCGKRKITNAEIHEACESYWNFVDEAIKSGELDDNTTKIDAFFDDLITRGAALCNKLLDDKMKKHLWTLARESEILVLITGLLQVPWEALYNPDIDPGSFLLDHCVIVRRPGDSGDISSAAGGVFKFSKERMICVDRLLSQSLCDVCVEDILRGDGEDVYVTSLKSELVQKVKSVQLVHWICEHDKKGLRLDSEIYYTADDSVAHRFQPGTVLVLTSCSAGARSAGEPGIAAGISAASNCTVIAPSSVVAARAGLSFVRKMNSIVRGSAGPLKVVDLWTALKGSSIELRQTGGRPSAEMCYALWYGIYGNGEASIRS